MTRYSSFSTLSNQRQSLSSVWEWRQFQWSLIAEEKIRLFDVLARGETPAAARYFGKTLNELDAEFAFQTAELNLLSMLGMLVCTEAALRVDFIERVSQRKKDVLSRGFRDAFKRRGKKLRLEEDILDVWRKQSIVGIKNTVSEFKGALNLRHWLAHGRYWKPKLGRVAGYDAVNVFEICRELLKATGLTA